MVLYSIILPIYNQQQNLPLVLYLINQIASKNNISLEMIIVEDNSQDHTREIAHYLADVFKKLHIKIIERAGKQGLGSAYQEGLKECQGQFVIIMDADLSHHPKYIAQMIEKQRETGCDIVTGSRYCTGGGVEGWSFFRKLTSRTANFVTKFVLGVNCSDFTGSFRLYKKNCLQQLMAATKTKGYSFQMEILVRAKNLNLKIQEIPIIFVDRLFGESKLGPNQIFLYLKGVGQLFFEN